MNAIDNKTLEKKIRLLAFYEIEEKLLPFADMKDIVLYNCSQRIDSTQILNKKHKARSIRVWKVLLATSCLLVGISIFSVLSPVPVTNANGFLRRAQIWVRDILQQNISSGPSDEHGVMPQGYHEKSNWTSLQEIRDVFSVNLLEPAFGTDEWTLTNTKAIGVDRGETEAPFVENANAISYEDARFVTFSYTLARKDNYLSFVYGLEGDDMGIGYFTDDVMEYRAPAGTFYAWSIDKKQFAQIVSGGRIVTISSNMSRDDFFKALDGLHSVNRPR